MISAPLVLFTGLAAASAWFVVEVLFGFGLVFTFERFSGLALPQWRLPLAMGAGMGLLWVVYNALLMAGGMAGACAASFLAGLDVIAPEQASALLTLSIAGLFAATVSAPLTGTALIVEMTGLWSFTPAVLATALAAVATANLLHSAPIYDCLRDRILTARSS